MKIVNSIITFASWEDRFYLGMEKNIEAYSPEKIIMFFYREYENSTNTNRQKIDEICKSKQIELKPVLVESENEAKTWKKFEAFFEKDNFNKKNVVVDITTMPRASIYNIFYFLEKDSADINYVYYRPEGYSKDDWLSRDPGRPRLIFKHSGLTKLGGKTVLLILTGFDAERTDQLIKFFEPEITLLGFQIGEQYSNAKLNLVRHEQCLDRWKALTNIETFSLDAYSNHNGFKSIEPWIKKHITDSNIVMSSLGPKPSAVALYHLCKKYPAIALAYVPSKDYNLNYSYGLGSTITGKVSSKSQRKGK